MQNASANSNVSEFKQLKLASSNHVSAIVVDDIRENRDVLAAMLVAAGCSVSTFESGELALEAMIHQPPPDIAFIDIMMPGLDGTETARRIITRHGRYRVRLVATSASALAHEQLQYQAAGFDDILTKPLRCERVYLSLSTLLGVEFEVDQNSSSAPAVADSLEATVLPARIRSRLVEAAEICNVTEIKQTLFEAERENAEYRPDIERVRGWLQAYNFKAISAFAAHSEELAVNQA